VAGGEASASARARLALAILTVCTALALSSAAAAAGAPVSLGPSHMGVALAAPTPPTLGEADEVTYEWRRCAFYTTLVAVDGATHMWRLDDASAGTAAADVLGSAPGRYVGAHAAAASDPLVDQGATGAAFDGSTSGVELAGVADEPGTDAYTFELWARPERVDGVYRFLISREETIAGKRAGTGVWLSKAGLGFERWSGGHSTTVDYAAGLPLGEWSYVVASYDGATMRLYVDGVQVGSKATIAPLSEVAGATVVGAGAGANGGFFAGDLADVALYPLALARAHVAADYADGTHAACTTIAQARGSTYTPVTADLGDTLSATVTATGASHTASTEGRSEGPVDDGHGNLALASIETPGEGETVSGTIVVNAALHGLPADRIEFDVDGQYRYAKVAEAPYQYTWYTRAESNGPHTLSVELWGPGASTPVVTEVTVDVRNATVYPTPLPFGEESMYSELNEGEEATAQDLLENVWPARGFPLPYLPWPLTWEEDPYHEAYWEFYFYGLRPEATLLYEWETTGRTDYLQKLIAILRSYVAYDVTRPEDTVTFDNDHTSAYRTMELINFYVKLKIAHALPTDLEAGLGRSLEKLGRFLAEPQHFEADYNHGFNEGAALLLLADNFPHMAGASGWRVLALERLREMLANTIDADGVEVENSPFYQVYVLGLVYQIAHWAKRYEPGLATPYEEAATKMLRYTADVTMPNGYLPMLGATATTYMPSQDPNVYGPMAAADPEFDFAYTRGARGTPPPDGTVLFPVSGLFLMRSPLGAVTNLPNQTFVTFNAGTYRTSHSDLDAMGITMYSNGAEVLPTSGLYTYTEEPDLEYFHGTRSHNTVVVDGKDQEEGSAEAGSHGSGEGATWASGLSRLYPGVSHHRTVVILRQGLVLVHDELASETSHEYSQTWHLAPNAAPAGTAAALTASAGGKPQLRITQADSTGISLQSFNGATDPMQGWYSSSYGSKQPSWALQYTREGTTAAFGTLLAAGPYAGEPATLTEHAGAEADTLEACVGATTGYVVTVPRSNDVAPTIATGGCPG
jgi:Heparinase II/III-like protein/Concanavalin A-like lectin/glucanases superfamily/Heparinase II/III N-terminus/Bacterial Ig domain